ncbi:hypothetical protein [Fimbriiglobus ruber]|uniref:Uncharacterized protein n=1 Tax=Fimbriiglobus ruber TaxID=1908690 RepID=A0A225DLR0_9BACT|nr:hypothetical protein [Fimbriiglobus ruber]OWK38416.1 hypothetical protein FRUB_07536 [Fimbriiglobus ruber]
MAKVLQEEVFYQCVSVDILFDSRRPSFGDLFRICGDTHPHFPPTGEYGFDRLADLQFEQVDDYFGVRSLSEEGDDVPVWLFPLARGQVIDHHPGPFDGVRLSYNVLRNPERRVDHFLRCVQEFAVLGSRVVYRTRDISLGSPPDLSPVQVDIAAITRHWAAEGIVVGSGDALALNY